MDVKKQKKKSNRKVIVTAAALVVCSLAYFFLFGFSADYEVDSKRLIFAKVESGSFAVEVAAPGELIPEQESLLFSKIDGTIEKIHKFPGSLLKRGDVIAEIYNPDLQQQRLEYQWEYEALEAEYKAKLADNRNELLKQEAQLFEKKMRRDIMEMELVAQQKLAESGQAQKSRLDLMKAELQAAQSDKAHKLAIRQLVELKTNLSASEKATQARLIKMEKLLSNLNEKIAAQKLVSNINGVLQTLNIELGDQVSSGQSVAKIADLNSLKARLNVNEHQVSSIVLGQAVSIDTRISTINGVVERIEPLVQNGTVIVEVSITDELPKEARPFLSVNGIINISAKENTLFVRRPYSTSSNQKETIYRIDSSGSIATKTPVQFGSMSGTHIEVLSGLEANDRIIVSDYANFKIHDRIKITL